MNLVTNLLGGVWALVLAWILFEMPAERSDGNIVQCGALLSLFFPNFYMAASWFVTLRLCALKRQRRVEPSLAALRPGGTGPLSRKWAPRHCTINPGSAFFNSAIPLRRRRTAVETQLLEETFISVRIVFRPSSVTLQL